MITTFSSTALSLQDESMESAGVVNELTISGNGFFVLRDPSTNKRFATQAGDFSLDDGGHLVDSNGFRLQGRTGMARAHVGDLKVSAPAASGMLCYSVDRNGKITVHFSDGTSYVRAQILLQNFRDPEALVSEGKSGHPLFSNLSAAGPLAALAAPGTKGLGVIQWGVVELADAGSSWAN
jgi:flagellar hook protein FlgE